MPRILDLLRCVPRICRAFAKSERGNVSIFLGFSMIPLVGIVGLGLDYGVALTDKSKLDNAADAAALAAVATAKAYVAANPTDTKLTADAISAGLDRATRSFTINTGNLPFAQVPTPVITLVRNGQTFSSTVTYTTTTQNHFGQIFGTPTMTLKGAVAAAADIPSYLDFYLLVDVSGSMGLPSTSEGQTLLASKNSDNFSVYKQGCQFACHFPNYTGWNIAIREQNIQLRSGAVNTAVCSLLTRTASPQVTNQYRVGIYPFITMMSNQFAPLSGSYSGLNTQADCNSSPPRAFDNLLDIGVSQYTTNGDTKTGTGSGGTNLGPSPKDSNSIFTQMQNEIATYTPSGSAKDGTSAVNSRPFIFLVTDGMENPQHYGTTSGGKYVYGGGSFDGLRYPVALDPTQCDALKKVATIAILYIPYVPLVYKADPYNENAAANAAIPDLPVNLQKCASTNFFYTANTPSDITAALNSMFNQAVQVAHLNK